MSLFRYRISRSSRRLIRPLVGGVHAGAFRRLCRVPLLFRHPSWSELLLQAGFHSSSAFVLAISTYCYGQEFGNWSRMPKVPQADDRLPVRVRPRASFGILGLYAPGARRRARWCSEAGLLHRDLVVQFAIEDPRPPEAIAHRLGEDCRLPVTAPSFIAFRAALFLGVPGIQDQPHPTSLDVTLSPMSGTSLVFRIMAVAVTRSFTGDFLCACATL